MHRDVVTHVAVSSADFFITGSVDGKLYDVNIYKTISKSPIILKSQYCNDKKKFSLSQVCFKCVYTSFLILVIGLNFISNI